MSATKLILKSLAGTFAVALILASSGVRSAQIGDVAQETPAAAPSGEADSRPPPLIPHKIDGFRISRDVNDCLSCHESPANEKAGARKAPDTHYIFRKGVRLDKISGTRFLCTQCHAPSADAKPLVNDKVPQAPEAGGRHE